MAIVADDERAVNAATVACVWKVTSDDAEIYWLVLTCVGSPSQVTYRFNAVGPRDEFYKKLIDSMG